jgi:hypothetical protein
MTITSELQVSLARLDAGLCAVRVAIQALMQQHIPDDEEGFAVAQYRAFEAAIRDDREQAKPQVSFEASVVSVPATPDSIANLRAPAQAKAIPDMPLGAGSWWLRNNGWSLVAANPGGAIELNQVERAILLHIATSREHRISRADLSRILGQPSGAGDAPHAAQSGVERWVIDNLRRQARALGHRLPLRVVRDRGYQFARTAGIKRAGNPAASESRPRARNATGLAAAHASQGL